MTLQRTERAIRALLEVADDEIRALIDGQELRRPLAADSLTGVVTTVRLSRQALRVIRQNYGMALSVNAGGLLLGAMGMLNPFLAAVLHNLSTLLVVFNAGRLIRYDPRPAGPIPRGVGSTYV